MKKIATVAAIITVLATSFAFAQSNPNLQRNTGTVAITGITQATLGGVSPADYAIIRAASTCGPAGNGQIIATATLNPGAICIVTVQFRPLLADPAGSVRNATVGVTYTGGSQSATLTGTAN